MKDNYYDALKNIIDAKIAGKEIIVREEEAPKVVDIMTALKASIDSAKKKPMEKAKGESAKKAKAEKPAKTAKRKAS
jgi:DNA end-binding protein Ku